LEPLVLEDYKNMDEQMLIKHLAHITDICPEIILACHFEKEKLVDIFDRAIHYFNKIAQAHEELKKLPNSYEVRLPAGKYACSATETFNERAVDAARINAQITGYEQSLTRLASSITTSALLEASQPQP